MEKEISQAVIRRMPRYYRYLGELLDDGVERISSNELSNRMKVTASQIRQDLNSRAMVITLSFYMMRLVRSWDWISSII